MRFDDAFIYGEFSLAAVKRSIPPIQIITENIARAFDEWARSPDKKPY
jgi:hypothetical protein